MNLSGPDKAQHYVLFGAIGNGVEEYVTAEGMPDHKLQCRQVMDLIVRVGAENPHAFHVGYAFGYDSNMIIQNLPYNLLKRLQDKGTCTLYEKRYRLTWRKGKSLTVTKYGPTYPLNKRDYVSVRIDDAFSFFATSMVKAVTDLLGTVEDFDKIQAGKADRSVFEWDELNSKVIPYWRVEGRAMVRLLERFRELVYGAGLKIKQWHGPGALASYAMTQHKMDKYKCNPPEDVNDAAQFAYAGGRFELFKIGRYVGEVYSYDINSAYPEGISKLPDLNHGTWEYVKAPTRIAYFGVYHLSLSTGGNRYSYIPSPLFMRDSKQEMHYPWRVEGWYWSPEAAIAVKHPDCELIEGWVWRPNSSHEDYNASPWDWVTGMYATRKAWKRGGNPAQLALKLCLNSMYGKMAQRVGATDGKPPRWHQLEAAGWVTSFTRAKLFGLMSRIGYERLIAVETDGIYCTASPSDLGITESEELGGWEVGRYGEVLYLQSGFYWLRKPNGELVAKYRGLDSDSVSYNGALDYLAGIDDPHHSWPSFVGTTSRFIGLGAALNRRYAFRNSFCRWETNRPREVYPGSEGKRIHFPFTCSACSRGISAGNGLHDLIITPTDEYRSTPHFLPWKNGVSWAQEMDDIGRDLISHE